MMVRYVGIGIAALVIFTIAAILMPYAFARVLIQNINCWRRGERANWHIFKEGL